jgi:hypothetical protein
MSLALLFHYLLLNMFRMLVHPSSGACDLLWIYFMCCIALVRCVLVLRCGSAGVVWYPYAGWSFASAWNNCPWNGSLSFTMTYAKAETCNFLFVNLQKKTQVFVTFLTTRFLVAFKASNCFVWRMDGGYELRNCSPYDLQQIEFWLHKYLSVITILVAAGSEVWVYDSSHAGIVRSNTVVGRNVSLSLFLSLFLSLSLSLSLVNVV